MVEFAKTCSATSSLDRRSAIERAAAGPAAARS